jgi:D-3-phosphoglycerate dehydrogenase
VGILGRTLGDALVNIAGMQVARKATGGDTLMALTVDQAVEPALLEQVALAIGARSAARVDLTEV